MSAAKKIEQSEFGREARARARARGIEDGARSDADVRLRAREYAFDALEVLRDGLDSSDEKISAACARDLAYVWAKLPAEPDAAPLSTPEQLEQIRQLVRSPPAALASILAEEGWKR